MIHVLIADDHTIFREGLKQIISDETDMFVSGEAVDGDDVLMKMRDLKWNVLVLDMSMPGKSGIALLQHVKALRPDLPVLVLSMHQESQYAVQAIKAGAAGYITKSSASSQLIEGIRKVAVGGMFISPIVAEKLALHLRHPEQGLPHTRLTAKEFQVFQMLIDGQKLSEIANALSVSIKTVSTHKANILLKMNIPTTAGLIYYAVEHKLVDSSRRSSE